MLIATAAQTFATDSAGFDFLTGPRTETTAALPADARRAMARLNRDGHLRADPRGHARRPYHVQAELTRAGQTATVYTRDVNAGSIGFITTDRMMVGAKVTLRLVLPDGRPTTADARVRRCRPFGGGWHEVFAAFAVPQYPSETL